MMEKAKVTQITKRISFEEFGGRAKIIEVVRPRKADDDIDRNRATEGERHIEKAKQRINTKIQIAAFWQELGGSEVDVKTADTGGNDTAFERIYGSSIVVSKLVPGNHAYIRISCLTPFAFSRWGGVQARGSAFHSSPF